MKRTKYYCDLCGKKHQTLYLVRVKVKGLAKFNGTYKACNSCRKNVEEQNAKYPL